MYTPFFPSMFVVTGIALLGYILKEVMCYQKAMRGAKNGDVRCQFILGMKHLKGRDVYYSKYRALVWLLKAADNGHLPAILQLCDLFLADQDYIRAEYWLRQGAMKGFPTAMTKLARIYGLDSSPFYNTYKSFEYYRCAAILGDHEAQFTLGMMYRDGIGVEHNRVLSYAWFMIASESGYEAMYADTGEVLSDLSADECSAAEYMAKTLKSAINNTRH